MTTELDALVVSLRADTRQFQSDLTDAQTSLRDLGSMAALPQTALNSTMQGLAGSSSAIADSVRQTFSGLEGLMQKFSRTGSLSFEDLRATALNALGDIAQNAIQSLFSGGGAGGGLFGSLLGGFGSLFGRAAGGPVTPSQPYVVGERGPELFVPRMGGEIIPNRAMSSGAASRPISITVNVSGGQAAAPGRETGTQVALAVRRTLGRAERFS